MNPLKFVDAPQPVVAIFHFVETMAQLIIADFCLTIRLSGCQCLGSVAPEEMGWDTQQKDERYVEWFWKHT
jgi:hypothetical protein